MKGTYSGVLARPLVLLVAIGLTGCASAAIEGARVGVDAVSQKQNQEDAEAGDPEAQFALGDSLCCSGDVPKRGVYSTEESIKWLCAAAEQGNADAMVKLGKIFSGDQTDGLRLIRRAVNAVTGAPSNLGAASYWFDQAQKAGSEDGAEGGQELQEDMAPADETLAAQYMSGALPKPCDWAALTHTG